MLWQTYTSYEFGPFRIDPSERQLLRDGQRVAIRPKVFDVLLALVQHNGRLLSKDEVMKLVWPNTSVEEGNLARNISTLRTVLGEHSDECQYIETVPWRGYRFVGNVRKVDLRRSSPPLDSLAVLPLVNTKADEQIEYLCDGITESLITNLARATNIRVTSRNSAFHYKGRELDARIIGRELNVQAVIMGRVAESEDLLSVSVELVDTREDSHVWGAQYVRQRTDLLGAQEMIAREITEKLQLQISGDERVGIGRRHSADREAYVLFLKGRYYFNKLTPDGVQKGAEYFQRALEKDPRYALAYAGLADCHNYAAQRDKAKEAITKALELEPGLGEAHATLGFFRYLYDWDFAGAESEFNQAITLSPNYAEAHHWYGIYLANMGRHDEALRHAQMAVERDPLSLLMNMTAALNSYLAREYDEAIDQLQKIIDMDANFVAAHSVLGCVYVKKEMYEEALALFEKVLKLVTGAAGVEASVKVLMAQALARSGNKREAIKLLDEVSAMPTSAYSVAGVHAALGDKDMAFRLLNKAYEQRDMQLVSLEVDPSLDGIRDDARFHRLVRLVGLPE